MIDTERLTLRRLCMEDSEDLFKYRSDRIVNRYQGWIPETTGDAEDFIGKIAENPNLPGTWFQLGIFEKPLNRLVGDIGIHFIGDSKSEVEIGCTIDSLHQSQGFATEALTSVIDYLLTELNKENIYAYILKDNINSIRLFRRLGFLQIPDADGYQVYKLPNNL